MIGNITTGSDFKPLMYYLLKESKNATILGGSVLSRCAATIAKEFLFIARQRPTTKKPVKHYSIGFAPGDGVISDELKREIAVDIVRGMGFTKEIEIDGQKHQEINNQYLVVNHHRHDPAHPKTHNHDHIHIAINLVNYDLERVNDGWDKRRLEKVLRQLELKYNLTPVLSSREYAKKLSDKKAAGSDSKFRKPLDYLKNVLQQQWTDNLSFNTLKERLARFGIKIDRKQPNKSKGRYQFTYQVGSYTFIKSDLKDNPYLETSAPPVSITLKGTGNRKQGIVTNLEKDLDRRNSEGGNTVALAQGEDATPGVAPGARVVRAVSSGFPKSRGKRPHGGQSDLKSDFRGGSYAPPLPVPYEATASVENKSIATKKKQPIPVYVVDQQKQSLLSDMKQAIADAVNKHTLDTPDFTTFRDRMKQDGIEVILYQTAGRKRKGRYKLKYRYQGGIEIRAGKDNGGSLNELIRQQKLKLDFLKQASISSSYKVKPHHIEKKSKSRYLPTKNNSSFEL